MRIRSFICSALLSALLLPLPAAAEPASAVQGKSNASAADNNVPPVVTPPAAKPSAPAVTAPLAQGQESSPYAKTLTVLFELFALAVVLESGLAVVFNWRPFLELFDSRGVKTVVSVGAGLVLVNAFDLDLTTELIRGFVADAKKPGGLGNFLTALVLAGGSSGVNNLMVALGFRSMKTAESVTPKPLPTKAWIAVRVEQGIDKELPQAKGALQVLMSVDGGPASVIGTIEGRSVPNPFVRYFLRDRGRYPSIGGYSVEPNKSYAVLLADGSGAPLAGQSWGPQPISVGAIVNIDFKVRND